MNQDHKIYVSFIDGTEVFIPIDATKLIDGSYQLQDSIEFDYEDDSMLFEYGHNDIVKIEERSLSDGRKYTVACERVKTGEDRNVVKNILYRILKNNIDISNAYSLLNSYEIERIINYSNTSPYPAIQSLIRSLKSKEEGHPTSSS